MPELVCSNCGSDRLFSTEETTIDYPIEVTLGPKGERTFKYTGGDRQVNDEATQFQNVLYCRHCTHELTLELLMTPREFAHRTDPIGDLINVDEDSDRGADIRFQGVCYASSNGYVCNWCGPWRHADTYVDDADRHNHRVREAELAGTGNGVETTASQLAYGLAARDMKQHLIDEGVPAELVP